MSRSGYTDECSGWDLIRWRGAVKSAIRGKIGQQFLKDLAKAMDEMEDKKLAAESLETEDGEYCTLGVIGKARGMDLKSIDPEDWESVASEFDLSEAMIREIVFENDERLYYKESGEQRFIRMRKWVEENILTNAV